MKKPGLTVEYTAAGSIAEEVGVEPGDVVLSVNGTNIADMLDYLFFVKESQVSIDLQKSNGEQWELDIEKDPDQDLGIYFKNTGLEKISRCANKCLFCFVDQMPKDLRKTLYIKDDDYKLSFLQGSFITLTNISDHDLDRIIKLRLSPLYVSVHTTNPDLRIKVLGNPRAGEIMKQIRRLVQGGIELHTQAVICPGLNDGDELDRTVADLADLWPGVRSLAVVPVGTTAFRKGLFDLRPFETAEAAQVVNKVRGWQDGCLKTLEYPFVFASDEFYFLAQKKVPSHQRYADFPQIENGVGLTRIFLNQWTSTKKTLPVGLKKPLLVSLVTGILGKSVLEPVAERLNQIENLQVNVVVAKNEFFGHTVTVAGLLTGQDILRHHEELQNSDLVVLPDAMMRRDCPLTLDEMSPEDIEKAIGVPVKTALGPAELVETIIEAAGE